MASQYDPNCAPKHFPCPYKGCKAVLRSRVSFDIHMKYFHKSRAKERDSHLAKTGCCQAMDSSTSNSKGKESSARPYCCEENECVDRNGEKKCFKSYAVLKQHYLNIHATKIFSCRKCGKMFSEKVKKTRHEADCAISYVCSCGISFTGKNGLLFHVKRTKHSLPEGLREYFAQKSKKNYPKRKIEESAKKSDKKKTVVSIIPKGAFSTPALTFQRRGAARILPRGLTTSAPPVIKVHTPSVCTKQLRKSRFVIDVYHSVAMNNTAPTSTNSSIGSATKDSMTAVPLPSKFKLDSLSAAMFKSGITPSDDLSPSMKCSNESCIKSRTSQTDWTVTNQTAQDFSCQTDEFLAWLDSESARCSSVQGVVENSSTTQIEIGQEVAPSVEVVQHETQTDDDWLSALLHDAECVGNGVSDAESQTNGVGYENLCGSYNTNSNNNHSYANVLSDSGCDIQTQTAFMDSMTDVTTQTAGLCNVHLDNTASLYLSLASDIQTQTDISNSLVTTTHTQTAWQCGNDLTEFLSMETQTESFAPECTHSTAARTQTQRL